ncbi:serine-rich adhesin for platelets isoform X1 [Drosophila subobscura]|uniref:serine-rich adhesin for platelets isoform X1 n=1 Tax=Drosophila subobscura TaxID=7241 RepID=UPI00155A4E4D|nr:serine-rich adhesin for platelets isoform X1 [Drosophila subobscura]
MAGESPESNSSESSPVQRQLNGSVDSGIAVLEGEVETPTLRRRQRLQQCQRILQLLQRDHSTHRQLRDRLSKIADRKWKKEEASEEQSCNVCCADLDQASPKTYVTCCTCGKLVCRGPKCADWRPKDAKWECQLCHSSKESLAHTSSWVAEQMSFNQHKFVYPMRARSEVYIPITGDGIDSTMHIESVSQVGQSVHLDERAKIRAYVEEIVAEMLGGNLDHIKVGQLSKSENYLQFFHKFHAKLSNLLLNVESDLLKGDLPAIVNGNDNPSPTRNNNSNNNNNNNGDADSLADTSQTRLRSLIETIIAETLRSSALSVSGAVSEISLDTSRSLAAELPCHGGIGMKRRHRTEHYFEPKIYQDLLATAVLNKIADKDGNTRLVSESTPDLSARLIDENYNAEALSSTSGSSVEPRSDCSLTDHELELDVGKSQSLQAELERESVLSDYIAAHMVPLPDFSASVTESEDDVGSISSSMIGDGTWEDNWLFKKKRSSMQSSATPSSIGMLVPAPKEHVRAQIGDRTADEVSDLSELGSDAEDNSLDVLRGNELNDRLLSKHLIGGQNTKLVLDELVDRSSLVSHTLPEEHEPAFTDTTNAFVVASRAVPSQRAAAPPPPMVFQDDSLNEELVQTPVADQLSSESSHSDESAPSTGCETFDGDGDSEQEFVSQRVLVLDERTSRTNTHTSNSNTNTNTNSNSNTHPTHTETTTTTTTNPTNPSRRTSGKLTNGSLRWSNKAGACAIARPNGGQLVAQQNDLTDDDDVVLLRRFVPGSIAEREVKKWYNAVEMPNNPYAPEALKQRISGTQERYMDVPNISPSAEQKALAAALTEEGDPDPAPPSTDYKRYSRDYYINDAPHGTEVSGNGRGAPSSSVERQPTAEDVELDIVINEAAPNASKAAKEQEQEEETAAAHVYTALPAQVLDDSLETQSNPSLHSLQTTTTTSDESETVRVYDFNKQETTVIRAAPAEQQPSSSTTSSMESARSAPLSSSSTDASVSKKRERPVVLQFGPSDSVPSIGSPASTPTRGSTPPAFRFLQPKRRLIEPSQVLSVDEDDWPEPSTPGAEKPAVEDEVAHAMPSVKALAQAFLLTSKAQQAERRWRSKVRMAATHDSSDKPATSLARRPKLEHAVSMAEVADESTIASDLSSLETDPSMHSDGSMNPPIASPVSPVPVRHGFLRSNIAFFENLKFK